MKPEMERVLRSKQQARKNYNSFSRWYDLFTNSEKRFTDIGIQMLDVQTNESVLEIGCGTGYALEKFTSTNRNIFAFDLSEKMLKVARRKTHNKDAGFCQADGSSIPFSNGQFDCVFISFTLELFDTPEISKVLAEIYRILKQDGKLGIVSLAKQERLSIRIYEWFHRQMPTLVDCRPIYLQPYITEIGFHVLQSRLNTMWGLPVEILIAQK